MAERMAAAAGAGAAAVVPRICIVGGGIPGLTTAFFLQRSLPHARITVVERASKLGGQIQSIRGSNGRVFEQGFHSSILVNKSGREALGLMRILGLEDEVISAHIEASARRHILHGGKVQILPKLWHMLRYGPALLTEPFKRRGREEDESVHAFVARRSSSGIADFLADSLCRGQLASDARRVSVRTCYPRLWFNERHFRSVFVGAAFSIRLAHQRRSWLSLDFLDPLLQRITAKGRSYTLKSGLGTLCTRLEERMTAPGVGVRSVEILTNTAVSSIQPTTRDGAEADEIKPEVEIMLDSGRSLPADTVVAAIPPKELAHILESSGIDMKDVSPSGQSLCEALNGVEFSPVTVINVAFDKDVLKGRFKGAGYFCSSLEGQPILAVTSDSQLFAEQDPVPGRTRLSVYVDGNACPDAVEAEKVAVEALKSHLHITEDPNEVYCTVWAAAAPQYELGHRAMMRAVDDARMDQLPWLQVAGPGYYGTRAVADEVVDARELADSLARRFERFPSLVENELEEETLRRYGGGFDAD